MKINTIVWSWILKSFYNMRSGKNNFYVALNPGAIFCLRVFPSQIQIPVRLQCHNLEAETVLLWQIWFFAKGSSRHFDPDNSKLNTRDKCWESIWLSISLTDIANSFDYHKLGSGYKCLLNLPKITRAVITAEGPTWNIFLY